MNDFYKINFKGNNFYVDLHNIPEQYKDSTIFLKTSSSCGGFSFNHKLIPYRWYCLSQTGFFKYKTEIFILDDLKLIDSLDFDICNHSFRLSLYPRDNKELILWIQYINLLESIYKINIEYVVDRDFEVDYYDRIDYLKISFDEYLKIAANQNKIINFDCTSYEIIKTIFNLIDL